MEEIEDDPYLMYPDAAVRRGTLRGRRVEVRSRHADDALGAAQIIGDFDHGVNRSMHFAMVS